jgi:rRNA-processing protein FCF1
LALKNSVTIIFDTNFLMIPIRFGVDVYSELERLLEGKFQPVVPTAVIDEINRLSMEAKPGLARELNFALEMAKKMELIADPKISNESVDDYILRIAKDGRYLVATTDSNLRRRLRREGVTVIYLRQGNHLDIDGPFR